MTLTVPCSTATSNTSQSAAYALPGVGHAPLYVAEKLEQLGPDHLGDRLVPQIKYDAGSSRRFLERYFEIVRLEGSRDVNQPAPVFFASCTKTQ